MTDLNPWLVEQVDDDEVRRLAGAHVADPLACELRVDIVADPHTEDDDGHVWTRLSRAKRVEDVTPGSAGDRIPAGALPRPRCGVGR